MNVTITLEEKLHRAARHRAVDAGLSLSGWVAQIIDREVRQGPPPEQNLSYHEAARRAWTLIQEGTPGAAAERQRDHLHQRQGT